MFPLLLSFTREGQGPGHLPSPAQRAGRQRKISREGQRPGHLKRDRGWQTTGPLALATPFERQPSPLGWARQTAEPLARENQDRLVYKNE